MNCDVAVSTSGVLGCAGRHRRPRATSLLAAHVPVPAPAAGSRVHGAPQQHRVGMGGDASAWSCWDTRAAPLWDVMEPGRCGSEQSASAAEMNECYGRWVRGEPCTLWSHGHQPIHTFHPGDASPHLAHLQIFHQPPFQKGCCPMKLSLSCLSLWEAWSAGDSMQCLIHHSPSSPC